MKKVLSTAEVAKHLSTSRQNVRRWTLAGHLRSVAQSPTSRRRYYLPADVETLREKFAELEM